MCLKSQRVAPPCFRGFLRRLFSLGLLSALLSMYAACIHLPEEKPEESPSLAKASPAEWPELRDDMDRLSFLQSLEQSRRYFRGLSPETSFRYGRDVYSLQHMQRTIDRLEYAWRTARDREELRRMLLAEFNLYMSVAGPDGVLLTGYYEPLVNVSATKSAGYRFPVYRIPGDLLTADLRAFGVACTPSRLTGRVNGSRFVPYFDRNQIDGGQALAGRGLEIAWADNPLDIFFLQIQGSGVLRFDNGSYVRVGFDGQNGHPYRAIGKVLIEEGRIPRDRMSMQAIRSYLENNPNDMERVLNTNPSYVFFKTLPDGPLGCIGVKLTAGRSVATDAGMFPRGAPAFIMSQKPEADWRGNVVDWKPYSRFVFNQDTGGAIKGAGRVDVFWGNGEYARAAAGHSKAKGTLYFLVLKK